MPVRGSPPRRLAAAALVELVALSLPVARGGWGWLALVAPVLGLAAAGSGRSLASLLRSALALGAGAAAAHPSLSGLQLAVAVWYQVPVERQLRGALVVALLGVAVPLVGDLVAPGPGVPGQRTLVAWNVANPSRVPGFARKAASLLSEVRPDLVVLLDAGFEDHESIPVPWMRKEWSALGSQVRELGARLDLGHFWSDVPVWFRASPYRGGAVVLSRFPLRVLAGTQPDGLTQAPPVLVVELPEGELLVQPVHLWNPLLIRPGVRRQEALERLLRRLVQLGGGRPTVLAGDTNLLPWERRPLLLQAGFREAAWLDPWYGGSWPAPLPLARIDAVLGSPEVDLMEGRVLGGHLSDHRPVMARWRAGETQRSRLGPPSQPKRVQPPR